ncbi:MAG: TonB-dependent receptor [Terracidiphilus sp.]
MSKANRSYLRPTFPLLTTLVLLAIAAVFVVWVQPSYAQQAGYAAINGTVTDPTGAVVSGATVTITDTDTGTKRELVTNGSGVYSAPYLTVGNYSVSVSHPGFKTTTQSGIILTADQVAGVNITLVVGQATESVTVTAGQQMVETESTALNEVVNSTSVVELPLNGRDPGSLTYVVPGAVNANTRTSLFLTAGSNGMPGEIGASIDASKNGGVYFQLDGIYNMDSYLAVSNPFPNSDSTQEFNVMTSNFSPQYGGGSTGVVSVVTKSGTNTWHGDTFLFARNQYFNAKDYFSGAKDGYSREQYGMSVGGPIHKDRHFIFGNFQITKASLAEAGAPNYSPTSAMVSSGDFTGVINSSLPQLYYPAAWATQYATTNPYLAALGCSATNPDPGNNGSGPCAMGGTTGNNPVGRPIAGNNVSADPNFLKAGVPWSYVVDPVAKNLMTHLPTATATGNGLIYVAGAPQLQNSKEGTVRYDWTPGTKNHIMGRLFVDSYNQPPANDTANWLATGEGSIAKNQNYGGTWTFTPTASLVNIFKLGYDQTNASSVTGIDKGWKDLGSQMVTPDDQVTVLEAWGSSGPYWVEQNVHVFRHNFDLGDDLTLTKGKNLVVAGVSLLTQYYNEYASWGADPPIGFSGAITGDAFSDILFGDLASFSQYAPQSYNFTGNAWAAYGQDEIKLKPNLTLTLGVRWEPFTSPTSNPSQDVAEFIPGEQSTVFPNAPAGMVYPGDPGVAPGGVPQQYDRVSPRIGIAWQPKFLPNTSIRLAGGRFTQPFYWFGYGKPAPFLPQYNFGNTSAGVTSLAIPIDNPWSVYGPTGGQTPFPTPQSFFSISPSKSTAFSLPQSLDNIFTPQYKNGWSQNWNLSIEHQFGRDLLVQAAYVGYEGYDITTSVDLNPGIYTTDVATCQKYNGSGAIAPCGVRSKYPNFSNITAYMPIGTMSYNGLHLEVKKRFSHGLQFNSNFAWSKAFDLVDESDANTGGVLDPLNPRHTRGISSFNVPFVWNSFGTWQLPAYRGHGNLAYGGLGNWEVSGILTMSSGLPFTIGSPDNSFSNNGCWADRVPGVALNVHQGAESHWLHQYFNPAAFKTCAPGTFGNSGRNLIRGPAEDNLDMAVVKNFPFDNEQYRFQFRWEMFNATNTPFFNIPDTGVADSAFGQINSTNGLGNNGTSGNSSGQGVGDGGRVMQFALKFYW